MLLLRTPFFLGCLYLLHLLSSAAERNPPRPIISETFTCQVNLSIANYTGGYTATGTGHVGRDYRQSKQLINIVLSEFFAHPQVYLQLKRYDLKKIFTYTEDVREQIKHCQVDAFTGPFGRVWSWLYKAMYVGTVTEKGNKFEVWNYTVNNTITNSLWVNQSHRRQPIRYILDTKHQSTIVVNFEVFQPVASTDPNEYDLPKFCHKTRLPTAQTAMNFSRDFDDIE